MRPLLSRTISCSVLRALKEAVMADRWDGAESVLDRCGVLRQWGEAAVVIRPVQYCYGWGTNEFSRDCDTGRIARGSVRRGYR